MLYILHNISLDWQSAGFEKMSKYIFYNQNKYKFIIKYIKANKDTDSLSTFLVKQ